VEISKGECVKMQKKYIPFRKTSPWSGVITLILGLILAFGFFLEQDWVVISALIATLIYFLISEIIMAIDQT